MNITQAIATLGLAATAFATTAAPAFALNHAPTHTIQSEMMMVGKTGKFAGVEAKTGMAELYQKDGKNHLRVTADFKLPASPAPHWQVVDAKGNVYLLNQFRIAGDKTNRDIVLPSYIQSIAKVQVWCSFAEVLLGEASFSKPMMLK